MTTLYFKVAGGLQTGNVIIDAATGNVSGLGNANLGNLATANYFSGNGGLLTGLNASNIANGTIPSSILGNSTVYIGTTGVALNRSSGSLTLNGVSIDGSANYAAYAGNVTEAAQPNITSVGTLSSLSITGNITAGNVSSQGEINSTGNITAPFFIGNVVGNISGTITVPGNNTAVLFNQTGNAGASDALTFNYSANILTVSGNLSSQNANLGNLATANYFSGNGSMLTSITGANITGEVAYAATANSVAGGNVVGEVAFSATANSVAGGNVSGQVGNALVAGTVYTNAQPNITSIGTLTALNVGGNIDVTGNINVTGNLNYSNVTDLVVGDPLIYLGANNTGNLYDLGIVASYNDGSYYHTGVARNAADGTWTIFDRVVAEPTTVIDWANSVPGSFKAGNLTAGNIAGANLISGNFITGTLTTAAQPNITSVGTLNGVTVTGTLNATGASNVALGPVGNVHISGGTSGYLLSTDGSGTLSWIAPPSTTGITNGTSNIAIPTTNGNVNTSVGGTANVLVVTSTGANIAGYVNATGNITAGNIDVGNLVSANYVSGNGYLLTSITGGNVTGQVGNALIAGTVYTGEQPNITSVGTLLSLTVTGNVSSGGNIIGNGQFLTSITGGNITGQVGNALVAGTVYSNAQPNITSVGTLTSVSVSGNVSSGGNIIGDGQYLTNLTGGNVTGQVGNALVASTVYSNAQPNITSIGTLTSVAVTNTATVGDVKITGGILSNRANVSVSTNTVIDEFAPSTYRTAKYVISASSADGYQSAEIILVHNGSSAYISIYGSVCSNATADIVDFSSNINGVSGNVSVYATNPGAGATVNVSAIYLKT